MSEEKRLPPHITEDDIRLIAELITPTIYADAYAAGTRQGVQLAQRRIVPNFRHGTTYRRESYIRVSMVEELDKLLDELS